MVRVRKCSVPNCGGRRETVRLHTFPKTVDRAEKWRQLCQEPALAQIPLKNLSQRACICSKHFTRDQFTNSLMDRLNRNAMPSLFLPSNPTLNIPATSCPSSSDRQSSCPPISPSTIPLTSEHIPSQSISTPIMCKVNIREARKDDCPELHRLIQELAEYKNMPYGPKIDSKVLEEDGFGSEHPSFGCYVIEELDRRGMKVKLLAYALYYIAYSTWSGKSMYLEDIYVSPKYRDQGLGSKLFDFVVKKGLELSCRRMDFRVMKWNPATAFYKKKGAIDLTKMGGWHNFGLDLDDMEKLAAQAKKK